MTETPGDDDAKRFRWAGGNLPTQSEVDFVLKHSAQETESRGASAPIRKTEIRKTEIRKTDSKGRISLSVKDQYFTVHHRDDGSFVVTPLPKLPDPVR